MTVSKQEWTEYLDRLTKAFQMVESKLDQVIDEIARLRSDIPDTDEIEATLQRILVAIEEQD